MYDGVFEKDKAQGYGVYSFASGTVYTGQLREDKQHGFGVEVFSDGARYEGAYESGSSQRRRRNHSKNILCGEQAHRTEWLHRTSQSVSQSISQSVSQSVSQSSQSVSQSASPSGIIR